MAFDNIKTSCPMPGITFREDRRGGWSEIGVYAETETGPQLAAVITHPCTGAKWFVHPTDGRRVPCPTRGRAITVALDLAQHKRQAA